MAVTTPTQSSPNTITSGVTGSGFLTTLKTSFGAGLLNRRFLISVGVFLLVAAFAFLGPIIFNKPKPLVTVGGLYDPPSAVAWLGTDNFGRDVFPQLMYGTQTSLIIGVLAGSIATLIGLLIGTVA